MNTSCCNVNSGSAHVMHTLVFFSRLSLSESIAMSVFGLFFFYADVVFWGRPNYLGSEISRKPKKCYRCSGIWGRPDCLRFDISSMSWSKPFS